MARQKSLTPDKVIRASGAAVFLFSMGSYFLMIAFCRTSIPNDNPMTRRCSTINSMSCGMVGAGSGGAALRGRTMMFITRKAPNEYRRALAIAWRRKNDDKGHVTSSGENCIVCTKVFGHVLIFGRMRRYKFRINTHYVLPFQTSGSYIIDVLSSLIKSYPSNFNKVS
jgi:hypothetical protein